MSDELTIERLKRSANANLGAAYWEKKRGDTYRRRALALVKQARAWRRECDDVLEELDQLQEYAVNQSERLMATERSRDRLRALLARATDYAFHAAGCVADVTGKPCVCGYTAWRAEVDALAAQAGGEGAGE